MIFRQNVNCFWFIGNIFCEENTRTTAVFIIKYLRTFEFKINDEVLAENSWYFRNSLVRANYKNFEKIYLKIHHI